MKDKKIFGFKIDEHIIDIESHSEQEAFRLLGVNYWHLISSCESIKLLGELKKVTEEPYQDDCGCEILYRKNEDKIYIDKVTTF